MAVYVWEFEFFEEDGGVCAFPCGDFGYGATCGDDINEAVEYAADFLTMAVDDCLMKGEELPPMSFGHEPEHGGRIIAIAVSRELGDIPAMTASDAARELGISTARVAQLINSGKLESWKDGTKRMVSKASVETRKKEIPRPESATSRAIYAWCSA